MLLMACFCHLTDLFETKRSEAQTAFGSKKSTCDVVKKDEDHDEVDVDIDPDDSYSYLYSNSYIIIT